MPAVSGPSEVCTLPSQCQWSQHPLKFAVSLWCLDLGLIPRTAPLEHRASGWRGDWSCCCSRIPQSAPQGLFLFEKILLLNTATPYKEGPVLSHSPPLQLDWGLSWSGHHTSQLSTLPNWCTCLLYTSDAADEVCRV